MKTWIDFAGAPVFAIPLTDAFGVRTVCEGMLIEGPQGWGEFSPPRDVDDRQAARWLTAAIEVGTVGWPDPVRGWVPVAVTVPAVTPDRARLIVTHSGCRTAAVRVGDRPGSLAEDIARIEAVREALGPAGAIRCDANGNWDLETATEAVPALDRAAGGLEFVEQPCAGLEAVAALRRRVDVAIAIDQSLRESTDPLGLDLAEAADIAVLTVGALGGVRRTLRVAESVGLPCVAAVDLEASIGIAGGAALAGVLPETGFAAELGTGVLLGGDVVSEARSMVPGVPDRHSDGRLPVAPMPPRPDPERLREFAVTDPETLAWWRARLESVQRYL